MNNKGFTLVELLATIVIIGLLAGIATYSVIGTINNSKKAGEKIFTKEIKNAIESYLATNGYGLVKKGTYIVEHNNKTETITQLGITSGKDITIKDIIDEGFLESDKLINPANKEKCFEDKTNPNTKIYPSIKVYKTSEAVYLYYLDLTTTACEISEEFIILTTLDDELKAQLIG